MKRLSLIVGLSILFFAQSKAQFSYDSLSIFLQKAKIATYASGDESIISKCEEGCKEISYTGNKFRYRDRYFGEYNFTGEEIVWWNKKAIWSMNYFGLTDSSQKLPDSFSDFLKEALRHVDKTFPFRGPENFSRGDFEYINYFDGNLKNFNGVEKIKYKGNLIYKLYYHGGEIIY